ncbi:MAG: coproporphyrinogen dehydrogenase HemZ [Bacillota bacterium]
MELLIVEEESSTIIEVRFHRDGKVWEHREKAVGEEPIPLANDKKRAARLAVYRVLVHAEERAPSPWGILTGIRPGKIVHRLLDRGIDAEAACLALEKSYAISGDKSRLLVETAMVQRPYLLPPERACRLVSVYIGIPFCPTRCIYCSFPAYSLSGHRAYLAPFLAALSHEIVEVGSALRDGGWQVQTIYLGGGTPTSLETEQLYSLLSKINEWLISKETIELTVEAGRPDTISREKLKVCKEAGVNRLSINPQTMRGETLAAIGRAHTPDDIRRAMVEAREYGFPVINMDLIIGLPGEGLEDVHRTLTEVAALNPDNLTVHTLALKKASKLYQETETSLLSTESVVEAMQIAGREARAMGMRPYYLYRQKKILGNLENTGYSLPGKECLYNIQMIEERQTIIGLGVGAGSKYINPFTGYLYGEYNPKDLKTYIERSTELTRYKIDKLDAIEYNYLLEKGNDREE